MLRMHVISGVFQRNVKQYFTSVIGYLFIVVFVTLCAILTFSPQFFADNLANLDQLSRYFPWLLLFIIPAITMNVWAEERKQGTDSLLFTLPASDVEIMLGKFLAVVAVYTIALLFSLTQVIALRAMGDPDFGVIFTTYLGYWLAGLALLSIGMFASSLSSSSTIAFIIGAFICSIPVTLGYYFGGFQLFESLSIPYHLRDFTIGLVSLPAVVYFLSIVVFMLYLNLVVITKRHWSRGQSLGQGTHFGTRIVALAVGLIAINIVFDRASVMFPTRADMTAENLYTLDQSTIQTLEKANQSERPVTIQAFVSSNVPRKYVNTRKNFIGLLRQYDRIGGRNVDVHFVEVKPASEQVKEAKSHQLKPKQVQETIGGRNVEQDFFMGAVVTSSLGDTVLPFIDSEASLEYELTRAIAATTDESRKISVGVLKTDYNFDYFTYRNPQTGLDEPYPWGFAKSYDELKRQYDVSTIDSTKLAQFVAKIEEDAQKSDSESDSDDQSKNQNGDLKGDGSSEEDSESVDDDSPENGDDKTELEFPDVLLVVDPSSLPNESMLELISYIESGRPVLICADPLPYYWISLQPTFPLGLIGAPSQPRISGGWNVTTISPEPKSNLGRSLVDVSNANCKIKFKVQFGAANENHLTTIFRYVDADNFWSLKLSDVGTFELIKTQDGVQEVLQKREMFGFDEQVPVDVEISFHTKKIAWKSGAVDGVVFDNFNSSATRHGIDLRSPDVSLQSFAIEEYILDEESEETDDDLAEVADADLEGDEQIPKILFEGDFGGACSLLCETLDIEWPFDQAAWQSYNPHPGFSPYVAAIGQDSWPEEYGPKDNLFLFARSYTDHHAFNADDQISKGLKEILFMYPGNLQDRNQSDDVKFSPLISLKPGDSGITPLNVLTEKQIERQQNQMTGEIFEGPIPNPYTGSDFIRMVEQPGSLERTDETINLAAHIQAENMNVVFIADTDFLTDFYHQQAEALDQLTDNFTLLSNAIESLAGDSTLVRLRNRRPAPRTLNQFELMTEAFRKERADEVERLETVKRDKVAEAEQRLTQVMEKLGNNEEMSLTRKMDLADMESSAERVRFENTIDELEEEMEEQVQDLRIDEQNKVQMTESFFRFIAILLAPLPALLLGICVFVGRRFSEAKQVAPERRVSKT